MYHESMQLPGWMNEKVIINQSYGTIRVVSKLQVPLLQTYQVYAYLYHLIWLFLSRFLVEFTTIIFSFIFISSLFSSNCNALYINSNHEAPYHSVLKIYYNNQSNYLFSYLKNQPIQSYKAWLGKNELEKDDHHKLAVIMSSSAYHIHSYFWEMFIIKKTVLSLMYRLYSYM